ncbi:hypothetical protein LXA43DRAFT_203546 [Ganoderma leucocontextum]|nr:hypothetical protein LXA43DRAFT_203546 [Ganoderma leucocontextum]
MFCGSAPHTYGLYTTTRSLSALGLCLGDSRTLYAARRVGLKVGSGTYGVRECILACRAGTSLVGPRSKTLETLASRRGRRGISGCVASAETQMPLRAGCRMVRISRRRTGRMGCARDALNRHVRDRQVPDARSSPQRAREHAKAPLPRGRCQLGHLPVQRVPPSLRTRGATRATALLRGRRVCGRIRDPGVHPGTSPPSVGVVAPFHPQGRDERQQPKQDPRAWTGRRSPNAAVSGPAAVRRQLAAQSPEHPRLSRMWWEMQDRLSRDMRVRGGSLSGTPANADAMRRGPPSNSVPAGSLFRVARRCVE